MKYTTSWICDGYVQTKQVGDCLNYKMRECQPSVCRMPVHLPNCQVVRFQEQSDLNSILCNETNQHTMLTEWFVLNTLNSNSQDYLYREIPQHFVWDYKDKIWTQRKRGRQCGRMYTVHPLKANAIFYVYCSITFAEQHQMTSKLQTVRDIKHSEQQQRPMGYCNKINISKHA
jgi:hypothetical protein